MPLRAKARGPRTRWKQRARVCLKAARATLSDPALKNR